MSRFSTPVSHIAQARILANNKELVAYTYRSKFASSREAEEWGASTLLQFRSDYFGTGGQVLGQAFEQMSIADVGVGGETFSGSSPKLPPSVIISSATVSNGQVQT